MAIARTKPSCFKGRGSDGAALLPRVQSSASCPPSERPSLQTSFTNKEPHKPPYTTRPLHPQAFHYLPSSLLGLPDATLVQLVSITQEVTVFKLKLSQKQCN